MEGKGSASTITVSTKSRIDSTHDALSGTRHFSTMDLMSRYWPCELDDAAKEKTAFITHQGLHEFEVLPFGLGTDRLFFSEGHGACSPRIDVRNLPYLPWWRHRLFAHLPRTLRTFRARVSAFPGGEHQAQTKQMSLWLRKSNFSWPCGICTQPDPQKISAVRDFPVPRNRKQVRSFLILLRLCNYYRKFLRNFAKIAEPLNKLTRRIIVFLWDDKCQQAFDQLKTSLTQAPILVYPVRTLQLLPEVCT